MSDNTVNMQVTIKSMTPNGDKESHDIVVSPEIVAEHEKKVKAHHEFLKQHADISTQKAQLDAEEKHTGPLKIDG